MLYCMKTGKENTQIMLETALGIPRGKMSIGPHNRKQVILICLMVFIVASFTYLNTLKGDFVWDDEYLVVKNSQVKSFTHLGGIFKNYLGYGSGNINNFYRPLQELSYMVDYSVWGENPFGFHLTNIILHALASVLVFIFLFYLCADKLTSGLSALFYAVHPVHTEAVSYIAGRTDSLYLCFMLLSLILFIRYAQSFKRNKRKEHLFYLSLVLFIFSLLAKEIAMVTPALIFLYVFFFLRLPATKESYKRLKWKFLPFAGILAVYVLLRLTVLDFSNIAPASIFKAVPLGYRFLTFLRSLPVYIRIIIAPFDLHMERTMAISRSFLSTGAVLTLIGLAIALWLVWISYKRNRIVSFAILWFFINLLPVSNIIPINSFIAEHWIYASSIGIFFLMSLGIVWVYRNIIPDKNIWKGGYLILIGFILGAYAFISVGRNIEWSDEVLFYKSTLRYQKGNSRIYLNLGNSYVERGNLKMAEKEYREALKINPEYAAAYGNLGSIYLRQDRNKEAKEMLMKALEVRPFYPEAHYNLGLANYREGKYKKSEENLITATQQMPQFYQAWNSLGELYIREKEANKAVECFKKSLQIFPNQPEVKQIIDKITK